MDNLLSLTITAAETLSLVNELKSNGLTQGKDFEFSFHSSTYTEKSYCVFSFTDRDSLSFYKLKWYYN